MSKVGAPEKLIVNGKRLDGRDLEQFRPMETNVRVIKRAVGSAFFAFENTKAIAAVYGPREVHPRHKQNPEKAIIKCKYFMAPFSTKERIRPGHSRRGTEISMVIAQALSQVIFFEEFPKTSIDVFIEIIQADASTRCAGLNAASMALADAGIPMRDLVSSCAVGKIDGELVLDVGGLEDNYGDVDFAVATVAGSDRFVLMQMDGVLTKEEFFKALDMAEAGCKEIYEKQKEALEKKYSAENLTEGDINE
ncbi:MAG: exosome complex exonuclease Rrp41 [Candidatus Aenigmarchaeota archaeon]|nr:exosome complex exonuclease Rrp41 [Candidatus Aenigmarchaeota archaeon]